MPHHCSKIGEKRPPWTPMLEMPFTQLEKYQHTVFFYTMLNALPSYTYFV